METRFSLSFRSIGNDNDDCYGLSVNSVSGYISLPPFTHTTHIYIYELPVTLLYSFMMSTLYYNFFSTHSFSLDHR